MLTTLDKGNECIGCDAICDLPRRLKVKLLDKGGYDHLHLEICESPSARTFRVRKLIMATIQINVPNAAFGTTTERESSFDEMSKTSETKKTHCSQICEYAEIDRLVEVLQETVGIPFLRVVAP